VTVTAAVVVVQDLPEWVEASGELQALPGRDVKLGALQPGVLSQMLVAEGDTVTPGQLLARVDPTLVRDGLSQAEAQLSQTRAAAANAVERRKRTEQARQAGVAAQQEVDDARAQEAAAVSAARSAEASVSTARNQVGRGELKAPFAGMVAHVLAAVGEPVDGSGKPLIELADTRELEVHARFAPEAAARLRAGTPALIELSGGGASHPATLIAIAPVVDPATGTVTARVRVPNADGALKVGGVARVRVTVAVHQGALVVPRAALVPLDQETSRQGERELAVEKIGADGLATRVAVKASSGSGERVQVEGELKAGDQVAVDGAYALPDGTRVRILRVVGLAAAADAGHPDAADDGGP
jgi:cobalt-zinc-cadmium efflux system membrane fusion protein